ncbi:MAG: MarR family winged helix-turn-helix transcriptional regulator [Acidobacteriota bacterium]
MDRYSKKYGKKADHALALWVKLARTHSLMLRLSARDISRYGLTQPQFAVIEALGHLGPMKISVLGAKMLVTGGNMTIVIDNLEKSGLVQRVRCIDDRRATTISLTEKGEELFSSIFPQHAEFVADTLSVLTDKEIEELSALLKKLGLKLQETFAHQLLR